MKETEERTKNWDKIKGRKGENEGTLKREKERGGGSEEVSSKLGKGKLG